MKKLINEKLETDVHMMSLSQKMAMVQEELQRVGRSLLFLCSAFCNCPSATAWRAPACADRPRERRACVAARGEKAGSAVGGGGEVER
jgi:hypothetical protein